MLLTCGLLRDAASGICVPPCAGRFLAGFSAGLTLRGSACGPWGRGQGPHACGQRAARRTVARPARARATRYPPEKMLDQYIGAAIENLASRMKGEIINHMPRTTLADRSPAKPRRPTNQ